MSVFDRITKLEPEARQIANEARDSYEAMKAHLRSELENAPEGSLTADERSTFDSILTGFDALFREFLCQIAGADQEIKNTEAEVIGTILNELHSPEVYRAVLSNSDGNF